MEAMMSIERQVKKVGIVTSYYENYNFGGLLQAYALAKVIKDKFGICAEQIQYASYGEPNCQKEKYTLYDLVYKAGILFFARINKKKIDTRKRATEKFMEEIPHSKEVYDYQSIQNCTRQYQTLICGGDQIWNVNNGIENLRIYTLQFADENIKKIAYAPSMAILEMNEEGKKCMEKGIAGLKAVSVREKESIEILKTITEKRIEVVADPALLLTKKEWMKELRKPQIEKKYVLCYMIGDNVRQRKVAEKVEKTLGLPMVTFPHVVSNAVRKCDLSYGDIRDYTSGPREFVGLIQNAEIVITDSFHACVFSMIFETPFIVFERKKAGETGNMNSRIYDFLEEYHLEKQLVTEESAMLMKKIPEIDFTYAYKHWEKRREESLKYLENALKEEQDGEEY